MEADNLKMFLDARYAKVFHLSIDGHFNFNAMKEIQLTQGKVALVDDEDFDRVSQFKWFADKHNHSFYACRKGCRVNGKQKTISMHGFILNGKWIDHRDGDGLNNQKSNLRFCNNQQNQMNTRPQINNSSKYKGVYYFKRDNRFKSQVWFNGKSYYVGTFDSEIEAAKAYDKKALELFGEFARLNFKVATN